MKKFVLMGGVLIMAIACSKKEGLSEPNQTAPSKKNDLLYLEEYEIPSNHEDILSSFISDVENEEFVPNKAMDEAVWLTEAAVNYKYRYKAGKFDSITHDSLYVQWDIVQDEVSGSDISEFYQNIDGTIAASLGSNQRILGVNVYPVELTSNTLDVAVDIVRAHNFAVHLEGFNSEATNDRQNTLRKYCNGNGAPNAAYEYAGWLAYAKYNGYSAVYSYGMNVQKYSSWSGGQQLTPYNLLGQYNSPISAHVYPLEPHDCVTISELNTYRDQIYTDVGQVLNGREVISIELGQEHYFCCSSKGWNYENVLIGSYGYTTF